MARNLDGSSDYNGGRLILAGSAFALGVAAAPLVTRAARHIRERMRGAISADESTVSYDQNLPEPLGRREPAPQAGQPRFGGTGSLGVHPAAAGVPPTEVD